MSDHAPCQRCGQASVGLACGPKLPDGTQHALPACAACGDILVKILLEEAAKVWGEKARAP